MMRNYEFRFTATSGSVFVESSIRFATSLNPFSLIEDVKSAIAYGLNNASRYGEDGVVFTADDVEITGISTQISMEELLMELQNRRNAEAFEEIIKAMRNNG